MTNKDYGIETTDYIGDINTQKLYTHCAVCNKQTEISLLGYYSLSVYVICDECKEAIKWAKEKMKNDK